MQSLAHQDQRNEKNKFTRILQKKLIKKSHFFEKLLRHFSMAKSIQACILCALMLRMMGIKKNSKIIAVKYWLSNKDRKWKLLRDMRTSKTRIHLFYFHYLHC